MDKGRKRWLMRVAIVLVVGVAGLLWMAGDQSRNLVIENHSGQTILLLEVTIAGQKNTFREVKSETERNAPFQGKEGDRYTVTGQLADATRIRSSGRLGESLHVLILPGGNVRFRPKSRFGS